ncbi:cysteine-rich receptor-like protein kinase 8 isoform X2 [Beta vulgaris subsp. vulgaris]|uniref:cysteine-rich receptor-like protein kinase 8 isoform X2 n=1 Tax=Beta vulgaris subsp. vulgaris TaxID=3555 RepID=UPI00254747A5|nr:cysteine-rich receptor-like protein kinase 8 isoform X2 [Beta vulgaris subsp. vulgaris]
MAPPKISSLILFSILLLLTFPKSSSLPTYLYSICPNTTFPSNSKYKSNLNTLLHSLSSNVTTNHSGFYITSVGNGTSDAAYGLFLCRGDLNATSCTDCVKTATTTDLPRTYCPTSNVATIWYDECMVRYSNVSLLGKMDDSPKVMLTNTQRINGNQTAFGEIMRKTVNDMAVQTANNRSGMKFTAKTVNFTSLVTLYALEQCTPDLNANDCGRCLRAAIEKLSVMQGARILQPSCNIRYEIYPFYNGAVNFSLSPTIKTAEHGEDFTKVESLQYDLLTLQTATNNFSDENKLGEGGFGGVFKGTLSNGQEIAVKRLSKNSGQGVQEFKNEVLLVAKLQHRNLVRLLGFCIAGEEKLLVYEYVPNKSLDQFLFDPVKQGQLDWGRRYKIIGGVARGMLYLHQDSRLRIIHRDLKVSNVLLDSEMNAKVSDFGMARIFGVDQTQGNTSKVVGTYGYMSPEYAMHGQFSIKSDVYSFGVLVLETISGKKNSSFYQSGYAEDLLSFAWKRWRDGMPLEFVDESIKDSCPINEVMRCMHLGLLCVQESIDDRPTMATAVLMLDSHSITLPMPQQPGFFIKSYVKGIGSDQSTSKSMPLSINDISVTEVEAR